MLPPQLNPPQLRQKILNNPFSKRLFPLLIVLLIGGYSFSFSQISYRSEFGTQGQGPGQFSAASGLLIKAGANLYLADAGNNRIQIFDTSGNFIRTFGSQGRGQVEFDRPSGIAMGPNGNLYVADLNNDRIQVVTTLGVYVGEFQGTYTNGSPVLNRPSKLAVSPTGDMYVLDNSDSIRVFDSFGNFQYSFGGTGNGNGQFRTPVCIACSPNGEVCITDQGNARVQVFTPTGGFSSQFGSAGGGAGQFSSAGGLTVGSSGLVYVTDLSQHRIQIFSSGGNFVTSFGSLGSGPGQFAAPVSVAVAGSEIWVLDTGNSRVQRFSNSALRNNPVPVLSEWALILLALTMVSMGMITVWKRRFTPVSQKV